jgi:hypothetical protein
MALSPTTRPGRRPKNLKQRLRRHVIMGNFVWDLPDITHVHVAQGARSS